MNVIRRGLAALCSVAAVAACAPDALKSDPAYDSFLGQLQKDCYFARIGIITLGDLLKNSGASDNVYFIDETSRLYAGQITPQSWTSAITAFLDGRESDPGVQCVLKHLPNR
jgi:hypothetical protein